MELRKIYKLCLFELIGTVLLLKHEDPGFKISAGFRLRYYPGGSLKPRKMSLVFSRDEVFRKGLQNPENSDSLRTTIMEPKLSENSFLRVFRRDSFRLSGSLCHWGCLPETMVEVVVANDI